VSKHIKKQELKSIILNLKKIDFIDSSGIGALIRISNDLKKIDGNLQIVTNPRVSQTIKTVRLEKFLILQTSLEDALNAIKKSNN
jgi:anti-anti-sigma factor